MGDVLTVREAADLLKLSEDTIRRKAGAGQIPGLFCGVWRFSRSALLDAMSDSTAGRGRQPDPKVLPRCHTKSRKVSG